MSPNRDLFLRTDHLWCQDLELMRRSEVTLWERVLRSKVILGTGFRV